MSVRFVRFGRPTLIATVFLALMAALFIGFGVAPALAFTRPVLEPCSPSFIGVPGSGQPGTNRSVEMGDVQAWLTVDAARQSGEKLRSSKIINYPAVAWYQYIKLVPLGRPDWNGLGKSEATGEADLLAAIKADEAKSTAADCPGAPILLAGYSQGAEVVVRALDALPAADRSSITVALLGDPSFIPREPYDLNFNRSTLKGIRPSFLLGQRYTLKADVATRDSAIDICAANDPICAYTKSLLGGLLLPGQSAHYRYVTGTYDGQTFTHYAANFLWKNRDHGLE
jgi:hypothetical protein